MGTQGQDARPRFVSEAIQTVHSLLQDSLLGATPGLLQSFGAEATYAGELDEPGSPSGDQLVGFLGFIGPGMKGCLTVATTSTAAEHLRPAELSQLDDPPHVGDWVCELANQLMGRVQNDVLRKTLELHLATPTSVMGEATLQGASKAGMTWHRYDFEGHVLSVRLSLEFPPGFAWKPGTPDSQPPLSEGAELIF